MLFSPLLKCNVNGFSPQSSTLMKGRAGKNNPKQWLVSPKLSVSGKREDWNIQSDISVWKRFLPRRCSAHVVGDKCHPKKKGIPLNLQGGRQWVAMSIGGRQTCVQLQPPPEWWLKPTLPHTPIQMGGIIFRSPPSGVPCATGAIVGEGLGVGGSGPE